MESKWSGTMEEAFFKAEAFDNNRILLQPEYEYSGRTSKGAYYVISVDVGRRLCATEIVVGKVTPQPLGPAVKTIVNLYTLKDMHFEDQAIYLKKLFYKYKARRMVIDGNGLGIGLLDYMVKPQHDPINNDFIPPFGVYNDTTLEYKKFRTPETELDAIFVVKANAIINTEAHSTIQSDLNSGKIKFLIDERQAKAKLLSTKTGNAMTAERRNEYLIPFTLTSILRDQMLNMVETSQGANIILKQATRGIASDKFSALEYLTYYVRQEEDSKKKKKKFNVKDFMFIS